MMSEVLEEHVFFLGLGLLFFVGMFYVLPWVETSGLFVLNEEVELETVEVNFLATPYQAVPREVVQDKKLVITDINT